MSAASPCRLLDGLLIKDSFQPVVDGTYVKEYPSKSIAAGNYAKIPVVLGEHRCYSDFIEETPLADVK